MLVPQCELTDIAGKQTQVHILMWPLPSFGKVDKNNPTDSGFFSVKPVFPAPRHLGLKLASIQLMALHPACPVPGSPPGTPLFSSSHTYFPSQSSTKAFLSGLPCPLPPPNSPPTPPHSLLWWPYIITWSSYSSPALGFSTSNLPPCLITFPTTTRVSGCWRLFIIHPTLAFHFSSYPPPSSENSSKAHLLYRWPFYAEERIWSQSWGKGAP